MVPLTVSPASWPPMTDPMGRGAPFASLLRRGAIVQSKHVEQRDNSKRGRPKEGLTAIECTKQNCDSYVFVPGLLARPSGLSSIAQGRVCFLLGSQHWLAAFPLGLR